jgi:hypothetical protein
LPAGCFCRCIMVHLSAYCVSPCLCRLSSSIIARAAASVYLAHFVS